MALRVGTSGAAADQGADHGDGGTEREHPVRTPAGRDDPIDDLSHHPRHGGEAGELVDRDLWLRCRTRDRLGCRLVGRRPQRGQIEIRGPAQPLGEEPERGVEVAVASRHDQVERRVALVGAEIANAFRHDLQVEVPLAELSPSCRWPPGRHRLVALLRPPTAIQHQRRHPSVQVGERLVVELTVRIVAVTVAALPPLLCSCGGGSGRYPSGSSAAVIRSATSAGSVGSSCGCRSSRLSEPDQR